MANINSTVTQTTFTPFVANISGDTTKFRVSRDVLRILGYRPEDIPTSMKTSDFFQQFFSKEAIQKYIGAGAITGFPEDISAIISTKTKTDTVTGALIRQVVVRVLLRNTCTKS